jgi:hypothetical protein
VGDYIAMGDEGCLFQVAVREVAGRVVIAADSCGYLVGEARPPQDGGLPVGEEGAPHAFLAGVGGAQDDGFIGDQFSQAGWPGGYVGCQAFEVCQVIADWLGHSHAA